MHHKKRFSLVGKWGEVDHHHSLVESSELGPTTRKTKAHSSHKLSFLFMTIYDIAVPHISCLKLKGWKEEKNYTSTVGQTFTFFWPHTCPNFWKTENGSTADFKCYYGSLWIAEESSLDLSWCPPFSELHFCLNSHSFEKLLSLVGNRPQKFCPLSMCRNKLRPLKK